MKKLLEVGSLAEALNKGWLRSDDIEYVVMKETLWGFYSTYSSYFTPRILEDSTIDYSSFLILSI